MAFNVDATSEEVKSVTESTLKSYFSASSVRTEGPSENDFTYTIKHN